MLHVVLTTILITNWDEFALDGCVFEFGAKLMSYDSAYSAFLHFVGENVAPVASYNFLAKLNLKMKLHCSNGCPVHRPRKNCVKG